MEKIIVGPSSKGVIDIDASVKDNLRAIAKRLDRDVENLVVVVLDRPRHARLIQDIRAAGARIRLITDGDLSAGISVALRGTGVHAVMGIGGAPEGVLTAAALRCLNGEILARLVVKDQEQAERMRSMGIKDPDKVYATTELASGKNIIFAATGVTDGTLLKGVRFLRRRHPDAVAADEPGQPARPLRGYRPPGSTSRHQRPPVGSGPSASGCPRRCFLSHIELESNPRSFGHPRMPHLFPGGPAWES